MFFFFFCILENLNVFFFKLKLLNEEKQKRFVKTHWGLLYLCIDIK